MPNINLLPWREEQRKERNRTTLIICCAMWLVAALLVFLGKSIMDARIDHQEARNKYLQSEIKALSQVIKEIEDLKEKRDALLARMEVIQNLQANRSQVVHVFDDLVQKLPKGVYYDTLSKAGGKIRIGGKAQSNGRVSALMRNLDSSDWFRDASLKVVDVVDDRGLRVSKFDLEVKEKSLNKDTDIESID